MPGNCSSGCASRGGRSGRAARRRRWWDAGLKKGDNSTRRACGKCGRKSPNPTSRRRAFQAGGIPPPHHPEVCERGRRAAIRLPRAPPPNALPSTSVRFRRLGYLSGAMAAKNELGKDRASYPIANQCLTKEGAMAQSW